MKDTKLSWILAGMGLFIIIAIYELNGGKVATAQEETMVDCNAGQSLVDAVNTASMGDTILVTGTCTETLTITTDRITIDGQGSTTIDGGGGFPPGNYDEGVVNIIGARGVILTGLTVQNGADGINGRQGAAFTVSKTTAQDNADDGIQVDENSTARISDCIALRNGNDGIIIARSSSGTLEGVTAEDNADEGIQIDEGSTGRLSN